MPITSTDISLYRRFDGDLDGLSRSAGRESISSEAAWRLLDDLRQRAVIVATGNGSEAFRRELEADLAVLLPDPVLLAEFRQIVAVDVQRIAQSTRD